MVRHERNNPGLACGADDIHHPGFGGNAHIYARFGLAGHNGLDFGVPCGTRVRAAADGVVTQLEERDQDGYGRYVRLAHGNGVVTLYAHLDDRWCSPARQCALARRLAARGTAGSRPDRTCILKCVCPGKRAMAMAGQ